MSFNPNAVFISPSSISDFKACPQAYFYHYVYRSPKSGLKIQVINPKLSLGATVHDTLHKFLYTQSVVKTDDQLINIVNWYWQKVSGEKGGFASQKEESLYKAKALKMLDTFWNNQHFKSTRPVKLPDFPKVNLGKDLILTGKLDWIEKLGEKLYQIVDFKTGQREEKSDSLQLPIYAVIASDYLKGAKIQASYWYLGKENHLREFKLPELDETITKLKSIGIQIMSARHTKSFGCSSGNESCWACRDLIAVTKGQAKLVSVNFARKQEIYIIPADETKDYDDQFEDDLPF